MFASIKKSGLSLYWASCASCAMLCLAASTGAQAQTTPPVSREVTQPTGATGATAFQPGGAARGEAEANSAQNGDAGMQERAKPGFDNKPPKGAKANCARPQGGVDVSGGENIVSAASKNNTSCTGKAAKSSTKPSAKTAKTAKKPTS